MEIGFTRSEFSCECGCKFSAMDYNLLVMLEDARSHFRTIYNNHVKIVITSGNRCVARNEEVQKLYVKDYIPFSSNSSHVKGIAVDHKIYYLDGAKWIQVLAKEVYEYYDKKYSNTAGVGMYGNRTHLDSRVAKARWGSHG